MKHLIPTPIRHLLRRLFPAPPPPAELDVRQALFLDEYRRLASLNSISVPSSAAERLQRPDPDRLFNDESIAADRAAAESVLEELQLPEMTGGVNVGDQRAIYYLVRGLRPRRILEIGTHIGCSTTNIALAVQDRDDTRALTVDIRDVNDTTTRPWEEFGSRQSPREMLQQVGCGDLVEFRAANSVEYLRSAAEAGEEFDFIFLDGDHSAANTYTEIPAALNCLSRNGVVLLHDYFPDTQPLWSDGSVIPGVFLATQRLRNEGAAIDIQPLGRLPWPTKLNSNVTSLALIVRPTTEQT